VLVVFAYAIAFELERKLKPPKKGRGPSAATKQAERYLLKNMPVSAKDLAARFKIDVSTIYRATWWKAAQAKLNNNQTGE
jgi:hypothetical protein